MMTFFSLPKYFDILSFVLWPLSANYLNPDVSLRNKRSWGGDFHVCRIVKQTARYDRNLNKNERNFPIRQNWKKMSWNSCLDPRFNVNENYLDVNYDRWKDIVLKTYNDVIVNIHN